jgi:[ribosomal protein S18]-alanine N-acetyltransferase
VRSDNYWFEAMDDGEAREIAAWSHAPPYDFYDAPNDLAELLDEKRRHEAYLPVRDGEGALVGSFQFEREGGTVDAGLGFLLAGPGFARRRFDPDGFTLSVATFSERAVRLYERAGFRRVRTYMHSGEHEFFSMAREA